MLNQKERQPLSVGDQVASIYSGTGGYLDRIKTERVQEFLSRMLELLHSEHGELMDRIESEGQLSDEDEETLGEAIRDFVDDFGPDFDEEGQPLEEGESDRVKSEEERQRGGRTSGDGNSDTEAGAEGDENQGGEEAAEEEEEKEAAPA
jgi:F-type H+-transporting ATPase subunit alpha